MCHSDDKHLYRMVIRVDGVCISNNKGNIVYWTSLSASRTQSSLQNAVTTLQNGACDDIGQLCGDGFALHINKSGCTWVFTIPCAAPTLGQQLSLVQGLELLHDAVVAALGTTPDTASSVAANVILVHRLVMELMVCGILQVQPLPRVLSQLSLQQHHSSQSSSLFGVVRLPSASVCEPNPNTQQQSLCLDVVERVRGSAVLSRTGLSAVTGEARGSLLLRCPSHLLNSAVTVTLDRSIPHQPQQHGDIHVVCCGSRVSWDGRTARCSALLQPTSCLLQYALPPVLPCTLHLTCTPVQHSNSDCEVVARLQGRLTGHVTAPRLTVRLSLPCAASTRHSGHARQSLRQVQREEKTELTWTVEQFPGDGEATAYVRVVGCGPDWRPARAVLDFEVSQWLCSAVRVLSCDMTPSLPRPAWIRYVTLGEAVTLSLQQDRV